ncbi:MAG: Uma2 family endonuclease [Pseudonocardiaceae bacterium]
MTVARGEHGRMATGLDAGEFTVDDLERMPDDGRRYELLDGVLLVSPAPGVWHQEAAGTLYVLLRAACPPELHVMIAPFEWRGSRRTALQPDVLVARRGDLLAVAGGEFLGEPPLLVVEVLCRAAGGSTGSRNSPSTTRTASRRTGWLTRIRRRRRWSRTWSTGATSTWEPRPVGRSGAPSTRSRLRFGPPISWLGSRIAEPTEPGQVRSASDCRPSTQRTRARRRRPRFSAQRPRCAAMELGAGVAAGA